MLFVILFRLISAALDIAIDARYLLTYLSPAAPQHIPWRPQAPAAWAGATGALPRALATAYGDGARAAWRWYVEQRLRRFQDGGELSALHFACRAAYSAADILL